MSIILITPEQAHSMLNQGNVTLIDVRETDEHALGFPAKALAVPRAQLEARPEAFIFNDQQAVALICQSGRRSRLAAESLLSKGYAAIYDVEGGYERWQREGLAIVTPSSNDADFFERYARHLRLPNVGVEGQKKLTQSSVLLIGAGGLGSPVAFYLAAAGVGKITLVDHDVVDKSNLQRQILHTEADIGVAKVESAAITLHALNSRVHLIPLSHKLNTQNVDALVKEADVVIDGSDNFPTRYVLSDACVRHAKPMVYAAVERFHGQLSVFDAGRERGIKPCYRCLFPEAPTGNDAPNCAEAGVIGVLPGVMGVLQAAETIKLLLGIGDSMAGRLLQFDALAMRFTELGIPVDPDCQACSSKAK